METSRHSLPLSGLFGPSAKMEKKKKMQIVQMGLCVINNSPGGVLKPQSVTRAKNHKVSAQAIENVWQAAMTWGSTAVQRGLREVADCGLVHLQQTVHPSREEGSRRAPFPGFFHSVVGTEWKKHGNVSFTGCKVSEVLYMLSHRQADGHTHTHMCCAPYVSSCVR